MARNGSIAWQHLEAKWHKLKGMPYSQNPYLPKVRAQAITLVNHEKWGIRQTARYIGVEASTVCRWMKRAPREGGVLYLPTRSSRPHHHPRALAPEIVKAVVDIRLKRGRCAEVIWGELRDSGIELSLSSVKRILKRQKLLKERSPWARYHVSGERPKPLEPGLLVETDSIHLMLKTSRMYIFTLIDCYSRWAWALASERLNCLRAWRFIGLAQTQAPFSFACVQSDHGPEFSTHFTEHLKVQGIKHRHIRVRQPNDNAHVERFNRTIQDELKNDLMRYRSDVSRLNQSIKAYLTYYNEERLHLGLNLKTPAQVLRRS